MTGYNPLIGENDDNLGPRFPDLPEAYPKNLFHVLLKMLIN